MNKAANLRYSLLFLGLPLLWVSSFAFTGQSNSSTQQTFEFEFLPVAVHASNAADYSADESNEKFAPVDEDIIIDVQTDRGLMPVTANVEVVSPGDANHTTNDKQEEPHRVLPIPESIPDNPGQGSVQEVDGDPGQSGEDNGNKDKDEDSPSQSGEDNGNKDKDEDSPGQSGEEHVKEKDKKK